MGFSFGVSRPTVQQTADQVTLVETLKGFEPFERLGDDDLVLLAARSQLETSAKGNQLFSLGDEDPWMFCLLEGTLELVAADGRSLAIDAGTSRARKPIAQLKPRMYSAVTTTPACFVRIDGSGFSDIAPPTEDDDYLVSEFAGDELDPTADSHQNRLRSNRLILPALPDVAITTCRLVDDDRADVASIAKAVSRDPVISAKLMKVANSPIFYGRSTINSLESAVSRLGLDTTRQMVLSFSLQDMFKSESKAINRRMRELWDHSVEVASLSFLLAQKLKLFSPEEAQLAGLIHDVPVIPILGYAQSQPDLIERPAVLDALVKRLRPEIGERLLTSWNFPGHLLTAVVDAESWWREAGPEPDLADLVVVAQLLSFIGKTKPPDVPNMSRLPAFRRISGGRLDPAGVLEMIAAAEEQLAELRALFTME